MMDMEGQVLLETAIGRMDHSSLELWYRVTNGLEASILLLTPLSRFDKEGARGVPERVYAYVDEGGILQVTKRLWLIPDDIDVVFPEVPFATEVGRGQVFEERITMALPISVDLPYLLAPEEIRKKREEVRGVAPGLVFSIGYMVEDKGPLRRGPAKPESGAGLVVRYGTVAQNQRILTGGLLGVGVPVRDVKR